MAVWSNDNVMNKALFAISSGDNRKLVLLSTDPTTKALATSTGFCCGLSTHLDFNALANDLVSGRVLWVKKTTDIAGRKCSTKWITHVGIIDASTLLFLTKCSTRSYTTAGPDLINASSWSISVYDPTT